jgi:DNA-directed RNA polymerase subunit RPC12/RpoP
VSAVVEAASKAFQNPDTEQEDAEAVGEPADLYTRAGEASVADTTIEPSTTDAAADEVEDAPAPTLLEQVSTPEEAVSTLLKDSAADQKNSETVIEPAPAEAQKVSDSKTLEVTCPKCESTDLRKNGRRQGKQRYICKDCGRQFVMPDSAEVEDKPKDKAISPVETSKAKASGSDTSISNSTSGSSKHQSKKKTKAKGFGSRKAK